MCRGSTWPEQASCGDRGTVGSIEGARSLTYQVLARKWRPQEFDAVVGQDTGHAHAPATRSLGPGRPRLPLHRAPRHRQDHHRAAPRQGAQLRPSGPAPSRAAPARRAASHRGPRGRRDGDRRGLQHAASTTSATLRENVKYAPARGRFKVYIIDEVHMLSERGVQRPPEDAGGAAPARRLHPRHHGSARRSRPPCSRAASASTSGRSRPSS